MALQLLGALDNLCVIHRGVVEQHTHRIHVRLFGVGCAARGDLPVHSIGRRRDVLRLTVHRNVREIFGHHEIFVRGLVLDLVRQLDFGHGAVPVLGLDQLQGVVDRSADLAPRGRGGILLGLFALGGRTAGLGGLTVLRVEGLKRDHGYGRHGGNEECREHWAPEKAYHWGLSSSFTGVAKASGTTP